MKDIGIKVNVGQSLTIDEAAGYWGFAMEDGWKYGAGEYAILPLAEFQKIIFDTAEFAEGACKFAGVDISNPDATAAQQIGTALEVFRRLLAEKRVQNLKEELGLPPENYKSL